MNRREIRREFVASTPERLDHWKQQLGEVEAEKDFIREQARVFKREDDQIARAELARVAGEMAKAAEVKNEGNSPTETSFCNLSPLIQANPTLAMLNHMAESLGMRLVVGLTNKQPRELNEFYEVQNFYDRMNVQPLGNERKSGSNALVAERLIGAVVRNFEVELAKRGPLVDNERRAAANNSQRGARSRVIPSRSCPTEPNVRFPRNNETRNDSLSL